MPTNQNSNAVAEIETLKAIYAAINRNDTDAALPFFDPQIERIEPEGSCDPEGFIIVGDRVVALLHVRVRLKNKQEWIDARFADGFIFRNGRVLQMRTFAERQPALDWAGATASSPILF